MSLFDDHHTYVQPPRPPQPPREDVPAQAAPRPPQRSATPPSRRLPPVVTGVIATLAVLVGVGIGHDVLRKAQVTRTAAGQGAAVTPGSNGTTHFGGSGYGPGGYYSYYGYYGYSGAGGGSSVGGSSSSSAGNATSAQDEATAAKVAPALVDVNSTFGYQGSEGAGTGIVLTSNGEILTNNHVVNGASTIRVTDIGNGQTYTGTVVGYDKGKDIAVVQLANASGLQTAKLGDSATAKVGDHVIAIGNAGGSGSTPTNAPGSITGLDKSITAGDSLDGTSEQLAGLIAVDAAVQAGDSGGSLVNGAGEVIGVDTAASAGFSFRQATNEGFAIPINQALAIVHQIESGQSSGTVHVGPTAFLGVLISGSNQSAYYGSSPTAGAHVANVANGGAAAKAGLGGGDVITSLNGQTVDSPEALSSLVLRLQPGQTVELGWVGATDGQSHRATVTLGSGPPA